MSSLSLPMPLASGFVAFDDAPRVRPARAPARAPARPAQPAPVVEREAVAVPEVAASVAADAPAALLQAPLWQPASSRRIRAVEGLVVAALCGWFLYGGLAVFSLV